jgi:hypothetical protein
MTSRLRRAMVALALVALTSLALASVASAHGGSKRAVKRGSCTEVVLHDHRSSDNGTRSRDVMRRQTCTRTQRTCVTSVKTSRSDDARSKTERRTCSFASSDCTVTRTRSDERKEDGTRERSLKVHRTCDDDDDGDAGSRDDNSTDCAVTKERTETRSPDGSRKVERSTRKVCGQGTARCTDTRSDVTTIAADGTRQRTESRDDNCEDDGQDDDNGSGRDDNGSDDSA